MNTRILFGKTGRFQQAILWWPVVLDRIPAGSFVEESPDFVLQSARGSDIIPNRRGYSSSVERQLPKLHRRVRLPLSAPCSSQATYRLRRAILFHKRLILRSFCCSSLPTAIRCAGFAVGIGRAVLLCSSFQNRKRFAGLRFWMGQYRLQRAEGFLRNYAEEKKEGTQ